MMMLVLLLAMLVLLLAMLVLLAMLTVRVRFMMRVKLVMLLVLLLLLVVRVRVVVARTVRGRMDVRRFLIGPGVRGLALATQRRRSNCSSGGGGGGGGGGGNVSDGCKLSSGRVVSGDLGHDGAVISMIIVTLMVVIIVALVVMVVLRIRIVVVMMLLTLLMRMGNEALTLWLAGTMAGLEALPQVALDQVKVGHVLPQLGKELLGAHGQRRFLKVEERAVQGAVALGAGKGRREGGGRARKKKGVRVTDAEARFRVDFR